MNPLEYYFLNNTGRLIDKWQHYFDIYDRHFSRFRGTDVHVVEFGVYKGGSLQMWRDYFGPSSKIYGVDINPHCKTLEEEGVKIFIGDQEDRGFLSYLKSEIPRIDILIDDGGHSMKQQIHTFEALFDAIDSHGVYLCEDTHTSYLEAWQGGYQKPGTFIEYTKQFVDYLHAWHATNHEELAINNITRSAHSIHYYDSIVVVEKKPIARPVRHQTGKATISGFHPKLAFRIFQNMVRQKWEKVIKGSSERPKC
jgi:hypothetical protein